MDADLQVRRYGDALRPEPCRPPTADRTSRPLKRMNHHRGVAAITTKINRKVPVKIVKTLETSPALAVGLGRSFGEAFRQRKAANKSFGTGRKS